MQPISNKSSFIYLLATCVSILPTLFSMDNIKRKPRSISMSGSVLDLFGALEIDDSHECITKMQRTIQPDTDLNYQSSQGTPLERAIDLEKIEAVDFLISKGSNANLKSNWFKETPLHRAARAGNVAIIQKLLCKVTDLQPLNSVDQTPLHLAVICCHIDAAREFINQGLNVNATTKNLMTPLHYACMFSQKHAERHRLINLLLQKGASLTSREAHYFTPFDLAINAENVETVTFLLTKITDQSVLTDSLKIAQQKGNQAIIRLLQEALNNKY